jgi:hypothetical protein
MRYLNRVLPPAIPPSGDSALADPAEPRLGALVGLLVLTVAPGAARTLLVALAAAGHADHGFILPQRPAHSGAG